MTDLTPLLLVADPLRERREPLCRLLRKAGFRTRSAASAAETRRALAQEQIHGLLIDEALSDQGGAELKEDLRRAGSPALVLIGEENSDAALVRALEGGADDRLPRPCPPQVLLARLRAVLRRVPPPQPAAPSDVRRFADRLHEAAARRLRLPDGSLVHLTSGENRLLAMFLDHPGEVLSRQRLIDRVRGRDLGAFDRTIDTMVSRLRRKIGDRATGGAARIIATEWGGGYRLCVPVDRQTGTDPR